MRNTSGLGTICSLSSSFTCLLAAANTLLWACLKTVLQLIDRSPEKQEEVLLEDNEAERPTGKLKCLSVVEDKLKQEGVPELSSQLYILGLSQR